MSRIERVISPVVSEPQAETWSNCLVVDGVAYVTGMTATGPDGNTIGDEYEQAKAIFDKIKALVEAAGGTMADVVKVIIYVTDITRLEEAWRARREFFTGNFPVSTLGRWRRSPGRRSRWKSRQSPISAPERAEPDNEGTRNRVLSEPRRIAMGVSDHDAPNAPNTARCTPFSPVSPIASPSEARDAAWLSCVRSPAASWNLRV